MYIPSSNIIETGYTQGNQYVNSKGEFYKGFYYKDNQNRYWSGKTNSPSSFRIYDTVPQIKLDNDYILKNNIISSNFTKHYNQDLSTPSVRNDVIQPLFTDFDKGYFIRYVVQLRASSVPENNIFELNYNNFVNVTKNINFTKHYKSASFGWKLIGPRHDVYDNNIRIEDGVEDTNKRSLQDVEKTIKGITKYFTNLTQFAIVYKD